MLGSNQIHTIKIHTKKLIKSAKGTENAALLCECSPAMFSRYNSYENETTMPIRAAMILMEDSGDFAILHYMAAYHGFSLKKSTPQEQEINDFFGLTAAVQKETSEAVNYAMEAIADGKISYAERERLLKELAEGNGAINRMMERIQNMKIATGAGVKR